jgi:thiosulfate/3-mercaptopyruvate sulfurtransferase
MSPSDSRNTQFPELGPGPLVAPESLAQHLDDPNVLIVDCRADIRDAAKGRIDYEAAHIRNAVFADLDTDLSDLTQKGALGRHPLPTDAALSAAFSRWNLTPDKHVVAYDDANGALAAARLWWLLRLAGHEHASVLDGGFAMWRAAGLPLESGPEKPRDAHIEARLDRHEVVWTDELERRRHDGSILLIDARTAPRYRGETEPIDTKAGHIPGALNRPFSDNLDASGRFKSAAQLRGEFYALIGAFQPWQVAHMCGSGVTACHNLLAMEAAGMQGSRVFAPSWSGWISNPSHDVATSDR